MHRTIATRLGTAALLLLGSCLATDDVDLSRSRWDPATSAQALFGYTEIEDDKFVFERSTADGTVQTDLGDMPLAGLAGQHTLAGKRLRVGIEGGTLFGWRSSVSNFYSGGGTLLVGLDTHLVLTELFFGAFASLGIGDSVRLWAGAGPQLAWAWADLRTEVGRDTESAFGSGTYWRAGLEFRLKSGALLGFSLRESDAELDFGESIGDLGHVDATQWMITYTTGL